MSQAKRALYADDVPLSQYSLDEGEAADEPLALGQARRSEVAPDSAAASVFAPTPTPTPPLSVPSPPGATFSELPLDAPSLAQELGKRRVAPMEVGPGPERSAPVRPSASQREFDDLLGRVDSQAALEAALLRLGPGVERLDLSLVGSKVGRGEEDEDEVQEVWRVPTEGRVFEAWQRNASNVRYLNAGDRVMVKPVHYERLTSLVNLVVPHALVSSHPVFRASPGLEALDLATVLDVRLDGGRWRLDGLVHLTIRTRRQLADCLGALLGRVPALGMLEIPTPSTVHPMGLWPEHVQNVRLLDADDVTDDVRALVRTQVHVRQFFLRDGRALQGSSLEELRQPRPAPAVPEEVGPEVRALLRTSTGTVPETLGEAVERMEAELLATGALGQSREFDRLLSKYIVVRPHHWRAHLTPRVDAVHLRWALVQDAGTRDLILELAPRLRTLVLAFDAPQGESEGTMWRFLASLARLCTNVTTLWVSETLRYRESQEEGPNTLRGAQMRRLVHAFLPRLETLVIAGYLFRDLDIQREEVENLKKLALIDSTYDPAWYRELKHLGELEFLLLPTRHREMRTFDPVTDGENGGPHDEPWVQYERSFVSQVCLPPNLRQRTRVVAHPAGPNQSAEFGEGIEIVRNKGYNTYQIVSSYLPELRFMHGAQGP